MGGGTKRGVYSGAGKAGELKPGSGTGVDARFALNEDEESVDNGAALTRYDVMFILPERVVQTLMAECELVTNPTTD